MTDLRSDPLAVATRAAARRDLPDRLRPIPIEWEEAEIDMLKVKWADGASGTEIAHAVNEKFGNERTRSAVIGKVHRLKLPDRPSDMLHNLRMSGHKAALDKIRKPKKKVAPKPKPVVAPELPTDATPLKVGAFDPLLGSTPVRSSESTGCQWPVGDEADKLVCNMPVAGKRQHYCAVHTRRSHGSSS